MEFIATAISHWHAAGVSVQIELNGYTDGLICIRPHSKDGYLIDESEFDLPADSNIDVRRVPEYEDGGFASLAVTKSTEILTLLYSKYAPAESRENVSIVAPKAPAVRLISTLSAEIDEFPPCVTFVTIDEGIGTYFDESHWERVRKFDGQETGVANGFDLETVLRRGLRRPHEQVQEALLEGQVQEQYLFEKENGALSIKRRLARTYEDVFTNRAIDGDVDGVLVTQPFVEYDHATEQSYTETVRRVVSEMAEEVENVAIKPHPRERTGKYREFEHEQDVRVFDEGYPIERLLAGTDLECVVGFTSTSLLTASAIFGIPTYTAANQLIDKVDSSHVTESAMTFRRLSTNYVSDMYWLDERETGE